MSLLPKIIYKFNAIAVKISVFFLFVEVDKHSKVYMENKWTWSSQNKFGGGKNKFRGYKLPDFKPYNKAEIIKTWYYQNGKYIDQWNRLESP